VQNALAKSSSTAFADLTHRVGTANVVTTAEQLGVDIAPAADGGSGLSSYAGDVNMGLGVAPLTVNEQDTMLSTIADDGEYHQAHLIKYWQQANGAELTPTVAVRAVLTAALDAQVQYAMEDTTSNGTAAATVGYGKGTPGTVIGVTGETSSYRAGSFLGATTQYSLAVGMFTSAQDSGSADSLAALGGGGYGGYWPSKIWNTFAEAEFSQRPSPFATKPAFSGADWDQVGKGATAGSASTTTGISPVPTVTCTVNGEQEVISGAFCPTPDPARRPPRPARTTGKSGASTWYRPRRARTTHPTGSTTSARLLLRRRPPRRPPQRPAPTTRLTGSTTSALVTATAFRQQRPNGKA
jgi:membrane peptidoglycan carboxypeptidase